MLEEARAAAQAAGTVAVVAVAVAVADSNDSSCSTQPPAHPQHGGKTKACSRSITRPRGGRAVVAVVAGWGRRLASSWLVHANLLVVNVAFLFPFVLVSFQNAKPDGKANRRRKMQKDAKRMITNTTCRRKEITGEKQKLDENVHAA